MRKWLSILAILGALFLPILVHAQSQVHLSSLQVQLWPEYDQPSMLVIYDFKVPSGTSLPIDIPIRFPSSGNLVAVASQSSSGSLVNTAYTGPVTSGDWQSVTVNIKDQTVYHLEYYEPISKTGTIRQFSYLWPGDYPINDFTLSVRMPVDTVQMTTDPIMDQSQGSDGTTYFQKDFGALTVGQQLTLNINYTKSSDKLSVPQPDVQPSEPLSTALGRVMFGNYVPYLLGGLGVILIAGGLVYFWRSGRGDKPRGRKRHAGHTEQDDSEVYCHQCGARAQKGDRFCRVCGTKLRLEE